jgi:cyclic beta-1,2-glucan synthetase
MSDPFAVQLAHCLRGHDPRTNPALAWLDRRLEARGTTVEAVVGDELQKQGMANATVRNVITSLRKIAGLDWTELFEQVSLVDAVLAGVAPFATMAFTTRNLCRTAVEAPSRGSGRSELDIARAVAVAAKDSTDRQADPGWYLIGMGRRGFEAAIGYRRPCASGWSGRAVGLASGTRLRCHAAAAGRDGRGGGALARCPRHRRVCPGVRRGHGVHQPAGGMGVADGACLREIEMTIEERHATTRAGPTLASLAGKLARSS